MYIGKKTVIERILIFHDSNELYSITNTPNMYDLNGLNDFTVLKLEFINFSVEILCPPGCVWFAPKFSVYLPSPLRKAVSAGVMSLPMAVTTP